MKWFVSTRQKKKLLNGRDGNKRQKIGVEE
jgi:hypothetical protein